MPEYQPQDQLSLWWLGDPVQPGRIGELSLTQGNRGVALAYDRAWLQAGFALSEDLPLAPGVHLPTHRDTAAGAVDDARPDRWGERVIRKFEKTPRLSLLELLLFAGEDRFGALGVSQHADAYLPWATAPVADLGSLDAMWTVVRQVLANEEVPERQRRLLRPGVSLGGARPKSLVAIDGEPWLVKFSEGEALDTELIEHAAMTLAARCGIEVAQTRALPVGGRHAIAIRRFDRAGTARIHAITANVALRAAGEDIGYPQLAHLLRRLAPTGTIAQQQEQLFRRMVFNILIDNTDDHEKNHALLRGPDGMYRLAPAYDVVPSAQGLGYQAMLVGATAESSVDDALAQAGNFGLKLAAARTVAAEVARAVEGWKAHMAALGVTQADVAILAQYIDGDRLKRQRSALLPAPRPVPQAKAAQPRKTKP